MTGIVLARLLLPEDFGLLALAMVFIGVADLIASVGMEPAVVQRRDLTDVHLRVATTLSLICGTALTFMFWALADPISVFFNEPRVAAIIPVLAFGLGVTAATATSRGLLIRRMEFRTLFKIDLFSYLVGYAGVAISMALLEYGVWSLVAGSVVSLLIQGAILACVEPLRFPLCFSWREAKQLLGFGGEVSLNEIINYFARNVDYVVIGRYLEAGLLGLYSRAYSLAGMPVSKIAGSLSGALFPAYAEIQDDRERLGRGYLKAVNATALVAFPVLTGFMVSGELVIVGLFGEKWRPAISAFQILSLAGAFKTIFHLAGAVAQATNMVRAEIKRQMVYLALLTVGTFYFVDYGIEAVSWVVVLASLWLYLSMAQFVQSLAGFARTDFFRAQFPGVCLSIVVALSEFSLIGINHRYLQWSPTIVLLVIVLLSAAVALLGLIYLPRRLIGDVPAWIFQHLAQRFPLPVQAWIARRFPAE